MGNSSSSKPTEFDGPAPTLHPKDSRYFTEHQHLISQNQNTNNNNPNHHQQNAPIDLHSLLQSYGELYVKYLEILRYNFSQEKSAKVSIAFDPLIVIEAPFQQQQEAVRTIGGSVTTTITTDGITITNGKQVETVSVTFKISHKGINKILNEVAKTGRMHSDHNIQVSISDSPIPQNMRFQLYDRFKERSKTVLLNRSSDRANAKIVENYLKSIEECNFPRNIAVLTANCNQFQQGWGLVGTATTSVQLNGQDGEVEYVVVNCC